MKRLKSGKLHCVILLSIWKTKVKFSMIAIYFPYTKYYWESLQQNKRTVQNYKEIGLQIHGPQLKKTSYSLFRFKQIFLNCQKDDSS